MNSQRSGGIRRERREILASQLFSWSSEGDSDIVVEDDDDCEEQSIKGQRSEGIWCRRQRQAIKRERERGTPATGAAAAKERRGISELKGSMRSALRCVACVLRVCVWACVCRLEKEGNGRLRRCQTRKTEKEGFDLGFSSDIAFTELYCLAKCRDSHRNTFRRRSAN